MTGLRRIGLALACLLLASVPGAGAGAADAPPQPARWGAILVAGDRSEPVFDNAVSSLAGRLRDSGSVSDIVALTSIRAGTPASATFDNLRRAARSLDLSPEDGCLFFMTSHGVPGEGLSLALTGKALTPRRLDRLLDRACGKRPTVVIASGCYSGIYLDPVLLQSNRVVLTASRSDRPSFGCAVDRIFTFYDGCLLRSVAPGRTWDAIHRQTRACVAAQEKELGAVPSQPQAAIGAEVEALTAWF